MNTKLVKNLIFPAHELLLGRNTFSHLRNLEQSQWYSLEEIRVQQTKKLRRLLKFAYKNVPYYRRMFDGLKIKPENMKTLEALTFLPFLTKKLVRENLEDLKAQNLKNHLVRMNTGGSTGEPLIFFVDKNRISHDKAANFRSRQWWGIDIGDKEIDFWSSPIELTKQDRLKYLRDRFISTKLLSAFQMNEKTMHEYAKIILEYQPKQIFGYAGSIYLFAQFLKKNKIDMTKAGIKAVFVTAEVLHDFQRKAIREAFSCPVANGYGGRDSGFIAHECPDGTMHITEDIIVEIINGEIVITHLESFGMPFIRYKTGDLGVLSSKPCGCGRKLPAIEKIEGRTTDFIITPDGRTLHALGLIYILRDIEGIEEFKIIQKSVDHLQIKIVKNGKYMPTQENLIREKIEKVMCGEISMDFAYVDKIEAEKSGKYKYVVSEAQVVR